MTKYTYWLEYFFLFAVGSSLLASQGFPPTAVGYLLAAFLFCAPSRLLPKKIGPWLTFLLLFGSLLMDSVWLFFLPATLRLTLQAAEKYDWLMISSLAFIFFAPDLSLFLRELLLALGLLAIYLTLRERNYLRLRHQLLQLKDDSWEQQQLLQEKNQALIASQENFVDLEIAEERNRIARDIHDNVGHLLSSSIIQLGALEALNQNQQLEPAMVQLKETIHSGMDSIRQSVHDLHSDSLNLEKAVALLLADFRFCPVIVEGKIPALSSEEEKVLLMVIKEALSNVMKHSQGDQVILNFAELPAFYRLKISDNGPVLTEKKLTDGIGLTSMRQRIEKIKGQLHLQASAAGFSLNIILPKEVRHDSRSSSG